MKAFTKGSQCYLKGEKEIKEIRRKIKWVHRKYKLNEYLINVMIRLEVRHWNFWLTDKNSKRTAQFLRYKTQNLGKLNTDWKNPAKLWPHLIYLLFLKNKLNILHHPCFLCYLLNDWVSGYDGINLKGKYSLHSEEHKLASFTDD